jgi:tetratricopeptide (TPR) repeat protein
MTPSQQRPVWRLCFALVLVLSGLIYLGAMHRALIWDDHALIGSKATVGLTFRECFTRPFLDHYFRPLVSLVFFLERSLWGQDPLGYHAINILLHILTTAALIGFARSLSQREDLALLSGLLFAIHPAQVGAIAWVGGRTDALCSLWVVLLGWTLLESARAQGRKRRIYTIGSLLAFLGMLLTKEQMIALLLLVPLAYLLFPISHDQTSNADDTPFSHRLHVAMRSTIPYGIVTLLYLSVGAFYGLPVPSESLYSLPEILRMTGHTAAYYALLLAAPSPQWMHTLSLGALERAGFLAAAFGYAIFTTTALLLLRWPKAAPGLVWFMALIVLSLLPVSNLIPMPFLLVAPYRAAVAAIGMAVLAAQGIVAIHARLSSHFRFLGQMLAAFIVVWWGGLTVWGVHQWRSEVRLFRAFVRYDPDGLVARYLLADRLLKINRPQETRDLLESCLERMFQSSAWRSEESAWQTLRIDRNTQVRVIQNQGSRRPPGEFLAKLYAQLGYARLYSGDIPGGRVALQIGERMNPNDPEVNLWLGHYAYNDGDYREAVRRFRLAMKSDPTRKESYLPLIYTLQQLGEREEAERLWQEAVRRFPDLEELHNLQRELAGDSHSSAK